LPTRSPEATKRVLLHRAPGAKPGTPTSMSEQLRGRWAGQRIPFGEGKLSPGDPARHDRGPVGRSS
jgi:hypothetical protein